MKFINSWLRNWCGRAAYPHREFRGVFPPGYFCPERRRNELKRRLLTNDQAFAFWEELLAFVLMIFGWEVGIFRHNERLVISSFSFYLLYSSHYSKENIPAVEYSEKSRLLLIWCCVFTLSSLNHAWSNLRSGDGSVFSTFAFFREKERLITDYAWIGNISFP